MHKEYRSASGRMVSRNDLALLQLYPVDESGKCATFNANVQPACLTRDMKKFEYGTDATADCKASGWGDTEEHRFGIQQSNILQVAKIDIQNFEACNSYMSQKRGLSLDKNYHLCGKGNNVDTCIGDSGGPLVCLSGRETDTCPKAYLLGITSFGAGTCNYANMPGIYVPIVRYYDWIMDAVEIYGPAEYEKFVYF